jgi:hypothetical protein
MLLADVAYKNILPGRVRRNIRILGMHMHMVLVLESQLASSPTILCASANLTAQHACCTCIKGSGNGLDCMNT